MTSVRRRIQKKGICMTILIFKNLITNQTFLSRSVQAMTKQENALNYSMANLEILLLEFSHTIIPR